MGTPYTPEELDKRIAERRKENRALTRKRFDIQRSINKKRAELETLCELLEIYRPEGLKACKEAWRESQLHQLNTIRRQADRRPYSSIQEAESAGVTFDRYNHSTHFTQL